MVNLESPVTLRGMPVQKPFNFRVRPASVAALLPAGISIVNIANNHIFDYGPEGLFDTFSYLDSLKIFYVGKSGFQDQQRSLIVGVRGHPKTS